jgi:hypothetical protein
MGTEIKIVIGLLICLATLGYLSYQFIRKTRVFSLVCRGILPEIVYRKNLSIGIFIGTSPLKFHPASNFKNPVLTAADVTDASALFVADPFLIQKGSTWYMFFEFFNGKSKKGEIGLAKSNDGFKWKYDKVILSEPFHLSYPYVFEWEIDYYMIPESKEVGEVRLYKAENFPGEWAYVKTLIQGRYGDPSIFYYHQKWWLFAAKRHDSLYLFFADSPMGPWQPHAKSPMIRGNPHIARPAGKVLILNGKVIRFAQDDYPQYGLKVHAFEITELSTETYKEKMVADSLLQPSGIGWNAKGMHHISAEKIGENQWIASVDGRGEKVKALAK